MPKRRSAAKPSGPAHPAAPTNPVRPDPVKRIDPVRLADPAKPTDLAKPAGTPRVADTAESDRRPKPAKPAIARHSARPPLPSTTRTYGKVIADKGGKSGKPPVPKAFAHRKR